LRKAFAKVKQDYTSQEAYAEHECTPPCTGKFGSHIDAVIRQCTEKSQGQRPTMKTVTTTLKELHRENKIQKISNTQQKQSAPAKHKPRFESALSN
jgi:hypothetical protein